MPKRWKAAAALFSALALAMVVTSPGLAQSTDEPAQEAAPAELVAFDARGVASAGSFCVLFAKAVPLRVCGGQLESTAVATSDPRAFGLAGLSPVPALSSIPLLIPNNDPITGTPVPEDVKEALKSFDFSALPTQCQATFPPVKEGDDENTCGGPTAGDEALGFRASELNGHVTASGASDDALGTKAEAVSRASEAEIPNLQAKLGVVRSFSNAGLNGDGRPQGYAEANIANLLMFGKVVNIRGLRSTTAVATDGTEPGTSAVTTFSIASASVAGVGVVIGPDGVTVAGEAVGNPELLPSLTKQVNDALADAGGVTLRMLPARPVRNDNGRITAGSGALEIGFHPEPEVEVLYRVGYTTAAVNSVSASADVTVPDIPSPEAASSSGTDASPDGAVVGTDTTAGDPFSTVPGSGDTGEIFGGSPSAGSPFGFSSAVGPAGTPGAGPSVGGLSSGAAGGANQVVGDPQLVQAPFLPAAAVTLSPDRVKLLYLAFLGFVAGAVVLLRTRRRLFPGPAGS